MTWRTLAVGWPFTFIRKPPQTLLDQKRAAYGGVPIGFRYTFPKADQWKVRIRRTVERRRSA